jgi:hypothetical protein
MQVRTLHLRTSGVPWFEQSRGFKSSQRTSTRVRTYQMVPTMLHCCSHLDNPAGSYIIRKPTSRDSETIYQGVHLVMISLPHCGCPSPLHLLQAATSQGVGQVEGAGQRHQWASHTLPPTGGLCWLRLSSLLTGMEW